MSTTESNQLAAVSQVVKLVEPDFNKLATIHGAVNFQKEASFALQALKSNAYLARVAAGDPDSLKTSILNVAAIGLSLSPVHKLAYLVPRKGKICLDISYLGYMQLAIDVGAIKWAKAEIVCENDKFEMRGLSNEPLHEFNPFGAGGKIIGAYCIAKTHDGEFLTTTMSIDEIYGIRDRSESWKAYVADASKKNPWVTDETEMIKKTVIRRAYKSWPKTDTRERLAKAIDVTDSGDPLDYSPVKAAEQIQDHQVPRAQELLVQINRTEEQFVSHLVRMFKRDIKKLSDLTEIEMSQAVTMLEDIAAKSKRALEKREA